MRQHQLTLELRKSKKDGLARLIELGVNNEGATDIEDFIIKPAKSERYNPALIYPRNALILHRFKEGQPLPKLAFDSIRGAERFLNALNEATGCFITENKSLWENINY